MTYLAEQGNLALVTICQNRIPNNKMPSEKDMKPKERGTSIEMTAHVNNIEISCVIWKDNELVKLLSTFAGQQPIVQATRFDKKRRLGGPSWLRPPAASVSLGGSLSLLGHEEASCFRWLPQDIPVARRMGLTAANNLHIYSVNIYVRICTACKYKYCVSGVRSAAVCCVCSTSWLSSPGRSTRHIYVGTPPSSQPGFRS